MTITYDPQKQAISFVLQWRGTIFPLVLSDPLFWLLFTTHMALLSYQKLELAAGREGLPPLEWNAASVSMGLLSFFVIFYGNHCYARYFELFGHCVGIGRTLTIFSFMVKSTFSHRTAEQRWNIVRPLLAGMSVHYATVYTGDKEDGVGVWPTSPTRHAQLDAGGRACVTPFTHACLCSPYAAGVGESKWQAIREKHLLTQVRPRGRGRWWRTLQSWVGYGIGRSSSSCSHALWPSSALVLAGRPLSKAPS
jgi:hypothetical protein